MVTRVDYNGYYELQDENGAVHSPDHNTPSFVTDDGTEMWYHHGTFHRDNDLPAIVVPGSREEWWIYGYRYRHLQNGPALIWQETNPIQEEYWQWNLQTDSEGNFLEEIPEWYTAPTQEWLDSLTPEELGTFKLPPVETEE